MLCANDMGKDEAVNGPFALPSSFLTREKERDLTQSYDKSPYTHRKIQKAK